MNTYDGVAASYEVVRPDYPIAIYAEIGTFTGVDRPRVLEVGIGTGQATLQMASLGWRVLGVEPGSELITRARARLADFSDVVLVESSFEELELGGDGFDVVAAATSWHWVDPAVSYVKAANVLRPYGVLALWWNAHVSNPANPAWKPIHDVYEQVAPHLADLSPLTPDRPDYDPVSEIEATALFTDVTTRVFPFTVSYTSEQFLMLIDTYASHAQLDAPTRERLHRELNAVIREELGGVVSKPYDSFLVLARSVERA